MHLRAVVGEWFEDLGSLDSRLWRTLSALLFRPGLLSAEFNAGRRAAYLPPFRLYLIVSFIMFLLLSISSELEINAEVGPGSQDISLQSEAGNGDKFDFNISSPDSPE